MTAENGVRPPLARPWACFLIRHANLGSPFVRPPASDLRPPWGRFQRAYSQGSAHASALPQRSAPKPPDETRPTLTRSITMRIGSLTLLLAMALEVSAQITPDIQRALELRAAFAVPAPPKDAVPVLLVGLGGRPNIRAFRSPTRPGEVRDVFDRVIQTGRMYEIVDRAPSEWISTLQFVLPVHPYTLDLHLHLSDEQLFLYLAFRERGILLELDEASKAIPLEQLTAYAAIVYHLSRLRESSVPFTEVDSIIATIERAGLIQPLKTQEGPKSQFYHDRNWNAVRRGLQLATASNPHAKGTAQHDVFDLVNSRSSIGQTGTWDDIFFRVRGWGIKALPALLEHIGDMRLSRSTYFMGFEYPTYVDTLVFHLLIELSNGHILSDDDPNALSRQRAIQWWNSVNNLSEEEYLVRHAVDRIGYGRQWVLSQIEEKYPHRLPSIFSDAVAAGSYPADVAGAIARSSLPKEAKVRLLCSALSCKEGVTLGRLIATLAYVDPQLGAEKMAVALRNASGSLRDEEHTSHPEALIGSQLQQWFDEGCYDALYELLTQLPTERRIELIANLRPPYVMRGQEPTRYPLAAKMLVRFFDDFSHLPDKFGRSAQSFDWRSFSVANLAALRASEAMGLEPAPPPNAGEDAWARYRSEIRKKIAESPNIPAPRPVRFFQTS